MQIKIIKDKISLTEIKKMAEESYGDMVKAVVDLDRKIVAIGGEWHADAEALLLDDGSKQEYLWGINIYPDKQGDEMIEYNSLINIRPKVGNRQTDIELPDIRAKIKIIINNLI